MQEQLLYSIPRNENLDGIQKYVLESSTTSKNISKEISDEMFHLFFEVIELGKEIRISLKNDTYLDTELKIADIFLALVAICNNLNINLYDALTKKEAYLNGKIAKWF